MQFPFYHRSIFFSTLKYSLSCSTHQHKSWSNRDASHNLQRKPRYIFLFVALHSWEFIFHLHTPAFFRISSVIMCLSRQTPFHWKRRRVKRVRGIKDGIGKPFSSPYILSVSFKTHCWGPRCWQRSWCLMRCKVQALTLYTWNRPPPNKHTHFLTEEWSRCFGKNPVW